MKTEIQSGYYLNKIDKTVKLAIWVFFYCFKRNLIALVLCHSAVGLPNLCHFVNQSDVKIKHLFRGERGIAKHIIIFSHTINSSSECHEKTGVHF